MTTTTAPGGARTGSYAQNEGAQSLGKGTGRKGDVREDTGDDTSAPTLAVTGAPPRGASRVGSTPFIPTTAADLQAAALSALQAAGMPFEALEPGVGFKRHPRREHSHLWVIANAGTSISGRPWLQVSAGDPRIAGGVDRATFTWASWKDHKDHPSTGLTLGELADVQAQIEAQTRAADTRRIKDREQARLWVGQAWGRAGPADGHPYLSGKGVGAYGVRRDGEMLLIPVRDASGELHSLQRISPDGRKRFMPGAAVTGHFHQLGALEPGGRLLLCEGYATGATIHEATGEPVAVAFNCGNLEPVARALRQAHPGAELVICADDDRDTEGNPGLTHARAAAAAVGGLLAVPDFGPGRETGQTDFNDLARLEGLEAVAACIGVAKVAWGSGESITEQGLNPATHATLSEYVAIEPPPTGAGSEGLFPPADKRPCYQVLDDWGERNGAKVRPGVYWCTAEETSGSTGETWVCSPMHVEAVTFDGQSNNFGRLLRFKNTIGNWREWAMPMELLRGSGDELRGELLAMGVELDPYKARQLLAAYLQHKSPKRRMYCATQTGWVGGSFVLPDVVIGPNAAGVIYQAGERGHDEYTTAGTLDGWKSEIAARAVGNPLLVLALSAGFAGPMLGRCNAEGGGIHFFGDSCTGKTALVEAACSIWGGPNYRRSWNATANGMEGAAALFNDCLLAPDEISECDPRDVGAIVYALGNGRGKQRASRSGAARGVVRWRCIVLSSGERTVATAMLEGGLRAKAGQSVRLLDVPAARTFGAWDTLHGLSSGAALSDALKRASGAHHGHAGRAFLERLTRDQDDFCAKLEEFKALPMFAAGGEGQDKRAAARLALVGMTGELASEYGLTGWPEGEAIQAAALAFDLWRSMRGEGNDERRQILEQVSGFIERHGDGRFTSADAVGEGPMVRDRAGWWRDTTTGREYLFTAHAMREALAGFDFRRGLDVLQAAGALEDPGSDGKRARFFRIGGRGVKLYPIRADRLDGGDHGA